MSAFRLLLQLHSPVILGDVVPRLDNLLQEAASRLHGDWETHHELPLHYDEPLGLYRASQLVFATTPNRPMSAHTVSMPTAPRGLERDRVRDPRPFREAGGFTNKLGAYQGRLAPYLLFFGDGDGERCAALLELLDGIGREHGRGSGTFSVARVDEDERSQWLLRAFPAHATLPDWPFDPIRATESLTPWGERQAVMRPPRILREVLHA